MKILNISLDKKILDKNSAVAKRIVEYGKLVDKFTVVVLASENKEINLSDKVKVYSIKKSFCKIYNFLRLKKQANKILKSEEYHIITAQDTYFIGWLAVKLAKKFKIELEVQVHGFEKFYGIRKFLAKKVLKNADSIRVVSQRLRRKLIDEFKINADKITVVPIYVERTTHNIQRITRNDDKFIILTVGRLVLVKNIEMQIEAMAKVINKNLNVELWIVGDGPERKKIEVRSKELELENSIKFLGWQDNLEKYYNQVDCFLLTSNAEGWGMAVVEAASYELPIIMTDVGLASEVIKNGESGIVIPIGNQKALENAMIKIIEDEDLRKKLGENAKEVVKKLPTKEETLELMKKSWEKAMKK